MVATPAPLSHRDKVNALIERVRVVRGLAPKCDSPSPARTDTRRTLVTDTGWAANFTWPLLLCTASRFQKIRDTPGRGAWSPALTWMSILPQALGPLQELLEPLRPALRLKVKLLLSQTIIAAQKRSWDMSFDMIQQFLIRQKRVAAAAARNRPPPRWYPIFSRVSHFKSIWPPSLKTTSYATTFLASGEDVSSAAFNKVAPTLGTTRRPCEPGRQSVLPLRAWHHQETLRAGQATNGAPQDGGLLSSSALRSKFRFNLSSFRFEEFVTLPLRSFGI